MFRDKSKEGNFVTERLASVQIILHLNISAFFSVDNEKRMIDTFVILYKVQNRKRIQVLV